MSKSESPRSILAWPKSEGEFRLAENESLDALSMEWEKL
jgi:hypothetical protein